MSEPNAQEPTMEEILASIRRIISEDEAPADQAAEAEAEPEPIEAAPVEAAPVMEEEDDVLELTERAPEPEAVETHGDLDVYVAEPEPELEPEDAFEPEPEPEPEPVYAAVADDRPLVSGRVAATTASAFGQLAQRLTMPKEGRTLEDVVRELLNPLLAAWLDENLPAIVQAKVDEEVERIARRRIG